jgi:hypothetical protein
MSPTSGLEGPFRGSTLGKCTLGARYIFLSPPLVRSFKLCLYFGRLEEQKIFSRAQTLVDHRHTTLLGFAVVSCYLALNCLFKL